MSEKIVNRLMSCLFLLICIFVIVHEVRQKPRILILHSYHAEYSWVSEVSEGLNRVFDGKPYSLQWHYMDTKRHPEESFKRRAVNTARQVIEQWQPHIILTVADNAQAVVKPYLNDPDKQIVFSGVFADPSEYGFDHSAINVTGIQERWPMGEIKKGIEEVFHAYPLKQGSKGTMRIRHIGDNSTTGSIIANDIGAYDWGEGLAVSSQSIDNFEDWKLAITQANSEVDIVIFSLYHTLYRYRTGDLQSNEVVPPAEVMAWTQANLSLPNLGGWGFFVEQGGMLAIGVSAYEQGEEAARLAVNIIDNQIQASQLPYLYSKQFLIYLRAPLLTQHNLKVPRIYEAFARANNNYYQ